MRLTREFELEVEGREEYDAAGEAVEEEGAFVGAEDPGEGAEGCGGGVEEGVEGEGEALVEEDGGVLLSGRGVGLAPCGGGTGVGGLGGVAHCEKGRWWLGIGDWGLRIWQVYMWWGWCCVEWSVLLLALGWLGCCLADVAILRMERGELRPTVGNRSAIRKVLYGWRRFMFVPLLENLAALVMQVGDFVGFAPMIIVLPDAAPISQCTFLDSFQRVVVSKNICISIGKER